MSKEFVQDWVTVELPSGTAAEYTQPQEGWVDMAGFKSFAGMCQFVGVEGVELFWETSDDVNGPWLQTGASDTQPSSDPQYAGLAFLGVGTDVPDTQRVKRYLRWHVKSTTPVSSGDCYACFRTIVVVK